MPRFIVSPYARNPGLILAVVFAALLGVSPGHGQPLAAQPVPTVPARVMRNGLGVSGRPGVDASIRTYVGMLDQIHVRDIRSPIVSGGISQARHWEELARVMQQSGMADPQPRFTALVGAYLNDPATTWAIQQNALLDVAGTGLLYAIEGPNEINNPLVGDGAHGPGDLVNKTRKADVPANYLAWARAIHDFKQAHAVALRGVRLVAPSIASGLVSDYAGLPDVSAFVEAGNIHFYAGGGRQPDFSQPSNPDVGSFDSIYDWGRRYQVPRGRLWLTEAGASTSGNYAPDGLSQAKYLANQVMEYFAAGGTHIFIHDLLDPQQRAGTVEDNFGLFRADGSAKPAATMLSALQDLVSLKAYDEAANATDTGPIKPGFDPAGLKLSWSGMAGGPSPRALVIAKSDGSTILAVWNEAVVDDGHGHDLTPPPQQVTLDFGKVVRFSVHDLLGPSPRVGTTPTHKRFDSGQTLTVPLQGYPMLVELSPPGAR